MRSELNLKRKVNNEFNQVLGEIHKALPQSDANDRLIDRMNEFGQYLYEMMHRMEQISNNLEMSETVTDRLLKKVTRP